MKYGKIEQVVVVNVGGTNYRTSKPAAERYVHTMYANNNTLEQLKKEAFKSGRIDKAAYQVYRDRCSAYWARGMRRILPKFRKVLKK